MAHDQRLIDSLGQDARVRKVSRMIPRGPLTHDQAADVLAAVKRYLADHDITQADLASGIGESPSTVSSVLTGRDSVPTHKRDEVLRAANNWIESDFQAREAQRPSNFEMTAIARRFIGLARQVRAKGVMGLCHGPAGIGKTVCALATQAEIAGTIYVCIRRDTRSATGLIRGLYAASKRKLRARMRAGYEDVRDHLSGSGRLLIVDQAHRLQDGALEVLMDLNDDCKLPVLLVATRDLAARVDADNDPHFGQLFSRIVLRADLFPELGGSRSGGRSASVFSVSDIGAIFEREGLKLHPDAARMLAEMACRNVGHLRFVGHVANWAEMIARKLQRSTVDVECVRRAVEFMTGQPAPLPTPPNGERQEATA